MNILQGNYVIHIVSGPNTESTKIGHTFRKWKNKMSVNWSDKKSLAKNGLLNWFFWTEKWFWKYDFGTFWGPGILGLFTKYINFLRVCSILSKNLNNFDPK